jgi:hypothetical protein
MNEKILKKKLSQKSFLLSSSSSSPSTRSSSQKKGRGAGVSSLLEAIDNLHVLQPKKSSLNDQKSLKQFSSDNYSSSFSFFSSPQLITDQEFQHDDHQDFVLKRTVSIETNLPLSHLLLQEYLSHQLISNLRTDSKYLQLFHQSKLWKFPKESQISQFSSSLHPHPPPPPSLPHKFPNHRHQQSHALDTVWRISKNDQSNPKYQLLLQEHLLLWQEALYSACQLFFNEIVSEIYFIGASSGTSSCRVILSNSSSSSASKGGGGYEALISCCPRSLYLKMIEAGLEVFTLLNGTGGEGGAAGEEEEATEVPNPTPSSRKDVISFPISQLSDKILHLKGSLSLRIFVDLFVSHSLSLHSVASYHRIVENLPMILTSQYFSHSSLQLNSLDASSSSEPNQSSSSSSPSPTQGALGTGDGGGDGTAADQKLVTINKYQLTGYFTHSSIKLLCHLLRNLPALERSASSPLPRRMLDPRVLRLKAIANDTNGSGAGGATGNGLYPLGDDDSGDFFDQKLLNPFQITRSNPTDTSLPLQLTAAAVSTSPRVTRQTTSTTTTTNFPQVRGPPSSPSSATLVSPTKSYFHLKFFSLHTDHVFNYLQRPPLSSGSHGNGSNGSVAAGERGGQILAEIRWNEEEHSCYEVDTWQLSPCRDHPVHYEVNRRNEEVVIT